MSTTTRTVREDQHGTRTGYSYGCRCGDCINAEYVYQGEWRQKQKAETPVNRSQIQHGPGVSVAFCKPCKWIGTKARNDGSVSWRETAHREKRDHRCT